MLRKLPIALVAAVSLGAAFAAPATSAKPGGGWGPGGYRHHHFGHFYIGVGDVDDGCYVIRPVLRPHGYRRRAVNVCT